MSKTISMTLSTESINAAIAELRDYQKWLERKADELRERVAELICDGALAGFGDAVVDVLVDGREITERYYTTVHKETNGDVTAVIAFGPDVTWIEFGTGVYFNGPVGGSPNPLVTENNLPFTIGGYGDGQGKRKAWGFNHPLLGFVITRGAPASMPMYKAEMGVAMDIVNIAREVFGS